MYLALKKVYVKNAKRVTKYFKILNKARAYLQTILKAPVKFQEDRSKTVEAARTRYIITDTVLWY